MNGDDLLSLAEPAPAAKLNSADLKNGLRLSKAAGYNVFFEVGNDTGTKVTRHADAVAIGIWPSTGHQIHGYEIKVSRGDFLSEMKNPLKSWPVMQFCHRWSLLTPPGLVKVDELPPNWGLQTFDGRIMRTVKQAPLLTPQPLSGGFVAALVRRAGEQDAAIIEAAIQKAKEDWKANLARNHEATVSREVRQRAEAGEDAIKVVKDLRDAIGADYLSVHNVAEYAAIIRAVRKSGVQASWNGLATLADSLASMGDTLKKQIDENGLAAEPKRKSA